MNKKLLIYILIAIVIVITLAVGTFLILRNGKSSGEESAKTGEIEIVDYSPQKGPAGSSVFLKLNSVPDQFKVMYNNKEIAVEGISEDTVRIATPYDIGSGDIQVKSGNNVSNSVRFTVEEMELLELASETVNPSSEKQTISYGDKIEVTLSPGLLKESKKLTISEVKNAPSSFISEQTETYSFDVSLEGMEQLDGYVEIGVKYDPNLLDPDKNTEDQFVAMRWDEDENYWVTLPTRVDNQNQTLYMLTDHLTGFEWGIIGAAVLISKPVTLAGEKLLNNSYVTSQGNFKILYSKDAIEEDVSLNDDWWTKKTYPDAGRIDYKSNYPKVIQDVGSLFETALASYINLGFENPVKIKEEWIGTETYKKPIIVKIDSWWLAVTGEPNYEKIWQRIHIPSIRLKDKDLMKATIGHELFHRMQAEYYGRTGFLAPSRAWWIEATAEYAGHNVAWPDDIPGLNNQVGIDFLNHSISTKGLIEGNGWSEKRYEYASAVFIKYLVENKSLNFREMVEYGKEGNIMERLDSFIRSKGGDLLGYYRDFAAWAAFSSNSFLAKYPLAVFGDDNASDIVSKKNSISLSDNQSSLDIEINSTDGQDTFVSVFKLAGRSPEIPSPLVNLSVLSGSDQTSIDAEPGDVIYLLAVKGSGNDKPVNAFVRNKGEEKEGEVRHTFNLKDDYSAEIWAVKIEGALKLTGKFIGGIEGMGYGQEVYRVGNTQYRIDIEGGVTLYIDSNCELWYHPEIEEEGCVYDISGSSEGWYNLYSRDKVTLSSGESYWEEWELHPYGDAKPDLAGDSLAGVINSLENSYYQAKLNDFYFLIRPSKNEPNIINSFQGEYDPSTNKFYAESFVNAIPGKGVYVKWESQPVETNFKKE